MWCKNTRCGSRLVWIVTHLRRGRSSAMRLLKTLRFALVGTTLLALPPSSARPALGPEPSAGNSTTQIGAALFRYALFATSNTCGALSLTGNSETDSFDSSQGSYDSTKQTTGGNVGANGNISLGGSTDVHGTGSSPHGGTGACAAQSITGLSIKGAASISGGMVGLSGPLCTPHLPRPAPRLRRRIRTSPERVETFQDVLFSAARRMSAWPQDLTET